MSKTAYFESHVEESRLLAEGWALMVSRLNILKHFGNRGGIIDQSIIVNGQVLVDWDSSKRLAVKRQSIIDRFKNINNRSGRCGSVHFKTIGAMP